MTGPSFAALDAEPFARAHLVPVHAVLDFLSDGKTLAARLGARTAAPLLCDLACAVSELARDVRARAVVRLPVPRFAWELGLERAGRDVLLTLFQGGALPEVFVHERRVAGDELAQRILDGLDALAQAGAGDADLEGLEAARAHLAGALPFPADAAAPEAAAFAVEPTGDVAIAIAADLSLRTPPEASPTQAPVLRADLFGLLFRGRVRVVVGEHARDLPDVFVFLFAEQLVGLAIDALEAWTHGRAFYRRIPVGGAICGLRLSPRGAASLTLGSQRKAGDDRAETFTFQDLEMGPLVQGVVAFGRALARSLVRRDRAQAHNLRVVALRDNVRDLADRLREATRSDAKVNAAPESYRAFAAVARAPRSGPEPLGPSRLRYSPKWLATVPSIDLRATFLCGDVFVVGATRETCAFERRTGDLLWQRAMPRAVAVVTPVGLGRLDADGLLAMHDLATGELAWTTKLTPRAGGSASGAVVSAPGLPRLLVVSEGARHLAAVDLDAGEVRWRHASRRGGVFRVRRAGKLLVVANGETSLTALDVTSGEVVWRFCDKLRFAAHVAVDRDALYAVAGGAGFARGGARLHHLDPWSGEARQSWELPTGLCPVGAPLLASETVVLVTQGRGGTGLVALDRKTGAIRFERTASTSAASCMLVDDSVVVNAESGELVAIDARDGATRYRHVFGGGDGDKPRRLEPVLRSGALFVPQNEVHVVRPGDGTILGRIPTDLIPDLLRVDERCDVYVVEESGHLAAFAAGPRLTLVQ